MEYIFEAEEDRGRGLEASDWDGPSNPVQSEIESIRAQLAAANAEVQEQARLNGMGAEREANLRAQLDEGHRQLLATQAHADGLEDALLEITEWLAEPNAHYHPMVKLGRAALSSPINLDALHEALALECERLHDGFSPTEDYSGFVIRRVLEREAAAHRAKKGAGHG